MDFYSAIRELLEEKNRLDRLIASLEALENGDSEHATAGGGRRRWRKSMSPEERREVSERMKRYWAARHGGSSDGDSQSPEEP